MKAGNAFFLYTFFAAFSAFLSFFLSLLFSLTLLFGAHFSIALCFAFITGCHRRGYSYSLAKKGGGRDSCIQPFSHINYSASDKNFYFLIGFHAAISGASVDVGLDCALSLPVVFFALKANIYGTSWPGTSLSRESTALPSYQSSLPSPAAT